MLTISENNRMEVENEFMALMLSKAELFDVVQIKPQYLSDKENAKIFKSAQLCYEKYKTISPAQMYEFCKTLNFDKIGDLLTNTFCYETAWKEQLKMSEESIVKFFKEDVVNLMNQKLKDKQVSYEEFMQKMKKLDEIELIKGSTTITVDELNENINTEVSEIRLNNFPRFDNYLKIVQGDFIIIGAMTGQGKSGFMLNLMDDLMDRYQCIYFNMEMSKSTIYKRLISIKAHVKVNDVVEPKTDYQKEVIELAKQRIEQSNLIIEHKANDIKQIKNVLMKYKDKNRHTILFIDHLGLTRADNTKSLYEQATEVAKQLRQMCLEYDCTIISASQLNRGAYVSDRPTLSQLKDSGELENSASKVILLYRIEQDPKNKYLNVMNVDIVKNRDGATGYVEMDYDKEKQIFREKAIR